MNARRLKLIVAVAVAVASSTWAGRAEATVVSFDSVTRAASDMLVIDGVTIAPTPWAVDAVEGQVATVEGIGLGTTGLFSPGFIDRFDSYGDCSSTGLCHGYDSAVRLSVNGRINSVTLRFYHTLDGPPKNPEDHCCAFTWAWAAPTFPSYEVQRDTDSPLGTLDFSKWQDPPSSVAFGVFTDFGEGEFLHQVTYLQNHGNPDATFRYGLSIVSVDYTPDPVPEASTVALLGAGLLPLVRRRRTARARA